MGKKPPNEPQDDHQLQRSTVRHVARTVTALLEDVRRTATRRLYWIGDVLAEYAQDPSFDVTATIVEIAAGGWDDLLTPEEIAQRRAGAGCAGGGAGTMAQDPECMRCGHFVHTGPVLCEPCATAALAQGAQETTAASRAVALLALVDGVRTALRESPYVRASGGRDQYGRTQPDLWSCRYCGAERGSRDHGPGCFWRVAQRRFGPLAARLGGAGEEAER